MKLPRPSARPGWIVAAVMAALLVTAVFGDKGVLELWRLRSEVAALHRDVQALEAESERLSRAITDLRDNPAVIERIAREVLGLVRPGERVLRFPKSPGAGDSPGTTSPNPARSP